MTETKAEDRTEDKILLAEYMGWRWDSKTCKPREGVTDGYPGWISPSGRKGLTHFDMPVPFDDVKADYDILLRLRETADAQDFTHFEEALTDFLSESHRGPYLEQYVVGDWAEARLLLIKEAKNVTSA